MVAKPQPPTNSQVPEELNTQVPLIGAKLRDGLGQAEQRILQALSDAGFANLQMAHFKVLRFPLPQHERPIDLAQRACMSKQAMNYLLVQLEDMGYVEREFSGGTGGRRISLTEKGIASRANPACHRARA